MGGASRRGDDDRGDIWQALLTIDFCQKHPDALFTQTIDLGEHALALVIGGGRPSGFNLVTTLDQLAVFWKLRNNLHGLGAFRVALNECLANASAFFLQIVVAFLLLLADSF